MSSILTYIVPVLIGLLGFLMGFFKKSSATKVKEVEDQAEVAALKTKAVMSDARASGVKSKDELISRFKDGSF